MQTLRIGGGMGFKVDIGSVDAQVRTKASAVTLATSRGYVAYQGEAYSGVERGMPRLILSFPIGPWIRSNLDDGVNTRVAAMHYHCDDLYQASNN